MMNSIISFFHSPLFDITVSTLMGAGASAIAIFRFDLIKRFLGFGSNSNDKKSDSFREECVIAHERINKQETQIKKLISLNERRKEMLKESEQKLKAMQDKQNHLNQTITLMSDIIKEQQTTIEMIEAKLKSYINQ